MFSRSELFDCFNFIIGFYNKLMIYLEFMWDVWVHPDYLIFMLLNFVIKEFFMLNILN